MNGAHANTIAGAHFNFSVAFNSCNLLCRGFSAF